MSNPGNELTPARIESAPQTPYGGMQRAPCLIGRLFGMIVTCGSVQASAQLPRAPTNEQDALVRTSVEAYQRGDYQTAKQTLLRVHSIEPTARTLRGLGVTCHALRQYVAAIWYLDRALASSARPLTDAMREEAIRTREAARRFVTVVDVDVKPATAQVTVDGRAPQRDANGRILLEEGQHQLKAVAAGFQPEHREVRASAGREMYLSWSLRGLVHKPAPATTRALDGAATSAAASKDAPADSRIVPKALLIAGGVLAAGGGVVLGLAHADNVKPLGKVGMAMIGVGVVSESIGLVWQLSDDDSEAKTHAELLITPSGIVTRGVF